MHPRIAELLEFIGAERVKLRAAVDSVPRDQHMQSAGEGRWSVAAILEHLGTVEQRITGVFRKRVGEAREAGIGMETDSTPILPGLGMAMIEDRTQRLAAPNAIHPSGKVDSDAAWAALEASRRELRTAVLDADGLALSDVTHPHLYFGPFSMYKWIAFIGSHEARHAAQIREIGATLGQHRA